MITSCSVFLMVLLKFSLSQALICPTLSITGACEIARILGITGPFNFPLKERMKRVKSHNSI